jgi:hypothetical protein
VARLLNRLRRCSPIVEEDRIRLAAQRLRELKAGGVELYEILGGQAGADFLRDYCEGDPEVAYAAITLVYSPSTQDRRKQAEEEQGRPDGFEESAS